MKRGIATFTLDSGHCPPWLFRRMVKLGSAMTETLIDDYGPDEFVARLADPAWFQALGTVLAFDWNASGLTTILTAALKEALRGRELELGVFICGGKGKTSHKTPEQIQNWGRRLQLAVEDSNALEYNSRMSAKVDSALVQDGYQIYHHSFVFSRNGAWTVVQQGMNQTQGTARRYHWHSANLTDLINEPHTAIAAQATAETLDLSAGISGPNRQIGWELTGQAAALNHDIEILRRHSSDLSQTLALRYGDEELALLNLARREFGPGEHPVAKEDFWSSPYLKKILSKLTDNQPGNYEKLLATQGVGPKTVRALSLVAEVIYGAKPSYQDPARYSFALGGKDATPFPVDRSTYDRTIDLMERAVRRSRLAPDSKGQALARLETQVGSRDS